MIIRNLGRLLPIRRVFKPSAYAFAAVLLIGCAQEQRGQSDESGELERFRCMLTGHWDNKRQADRDIAAGADEANRHERRAMTYIPVANDHLEGQLFGILNYGEAGFEGAPRRLSLHRFRPAKDGGAIVHEFLFLKDKERWGDLTKDIAPLTSVTLADVTINSDCAMYWRAEADGFDGRTEEGRCITSSFTPEPIRVEGHGILSPTTLSRHDRNLSLDGEPLFVAGGASAEIFDKVERTAYPSAAFRAQIEAVSATLECDQFSMGN
ncbi:MAG: CpcT/CpeT family chromophore lyase [Pseudomonadota bacterium]